MRRVFSYIILLSLMPMSGMAVSIDNVVDHSENKMRLFAGQVQYHAYLHRNFDALSVFKNAQGVSHSKLRQRIKQNKVNNVATKTIADIELAYRMSQHSGDAIRAILDGDDSQQQRNQSAYELAQTYYQKQQYDFVLHALQLIRGDIFYPFSHDVKYLAARTHARLANYEKAIELFRELKYDDRFKGFVTFNLAHTLIASGDVEQGLSELQEVGELQTKDSLLLALRDKANLVAGYASLGTGDTSKAVAILNRISLNGAFTNKALLGLAWAEMSQQNYLAALVPWTELHKRHSSDASVLESRLALPYVYAKLGSYGKAINLYEQAISELDEVQKRLQLSINSFEDGSFLQLVQQYSSQADTSWLLQLRNLPEAPETYYLLELLASKEFQKSINNYTELSELLVKLNEWDRTAIALQSHVSQHDEQLNGRMRVIEESLQTLDSEIIEIKQKRDNLVRQMQTTSLNGASVPVINKGQVLLASLDGALDVLSKNDEERALYASSEQAVSASQLQTQPSVSLTSSENQQQEIDEQLQLLQEKRQYVGNMFASVKPVDAYKLPLHALAKKIAALRKHVNVAMTKQADYIKSIAISELQKRKGFIDNYLITAKYELAKNYDLTAAGKTAE